MEKECFFTKKKIFIILVVWQVFIAVIVLKFGMTTPSAKGITKDHDKVNSLFTLIPEIPQNTTLLIAINTIPSKFERRETLRGTWAKQTSLSLTDNTSSAANLHDMMNIAYFFTVGFAGNSSIDRDTKRESGIHKDILRVNLSESYRGIVTKILLTFEWMTSLDAKPRFIVKADDDVYIKLPDLARWMKDNQLPAKLYAGFVHRRVKVIRSTKSPFWVQQYTNKYFPSYCAGPFYILSRDVFLDVVRTSKVTKVFPVEDAYIGVLVNKTGVTPKETGRSLFNWVRILRPEMMEKIPVGVVFGDKLSSQNIQQLHRAYCKLTGS